MRDGDIWKCGLQLPGPGSGPGPVRLCAALRLPRPSCLSDSLYLHCVFLCTYFYLLLLPPPPLVFGHGSTSGSRTILSLCEYTSRLSTGAQCVFILSSPLLSSPLVRSLSVLSRHATLRYVSCVAFRSIRCACDKVFRSRKARSFAVLLVSLNLFSLSPSLYIHSEGAGVFASLFTATQYLFPVPADPLPRSL